MAYKTLGVVLAGGKGTRVEKLYTADEPIKPLLRIHGQRLIDYPLNALVEVVDEIAVVSYKSYQHERMDDHVRRTHPRARVLHQTVPHKELEQKQWAFLSIIHSQMQQNPSYLSAFDSVMTLPCDMVFERELLEEVLQAHQKYEGRDSGIITMLSKRSPGEGDRKYLLTASNKSLAVDNERVIVVSPNPMPGYSGSTQAGVWVFSAHVLEHDFGDVPNFWERVPVYRHLTKKPWKDFGDAAAIEAAR